jgi:type IV pilus assembly protein PilA
MLNNIKTRRDSGFTIVELLIVVIVIGILAAITIVAYSNISNRAKQSTAKANAESVQKVVEAYAADDTTAGYPTPAQLNAYNGVAKLPSGVTVPTTVAALTSANGDGKTIQYNNKGTTGGCIGYWDVVTGTFAYVYAGNATSGSNTTPFTCG